MLVIVMAFLLSNLTSLSAKTNQTINTYNKFQSVYNQLPKTTAGFIDCINELEEDDDTEHKFQKDLFYPYIPQYLKVNNNHYTFNYFPSSTIITELYSGIPIYTATGNYRV